MKSIRIDASNVLELAAAMDKALSDESPVVEFAGEEIPTPVVGEVLTRFAVELIAEKIVHSIRPPADVGESAPQGETVH